MNDILPPKRPSGPLNQSQPPRPIQQQSARPQSRPVLAAMPPPKRPLSPQIPVTAKPKHDEALLEAPKTPLLIEEPKKKKRSLKKLIGWLLGIFVALALFAAGAAFLWYHDALEPVSIEEADGVRVSIADGSSPSQIGQLLEEKKLIRSSLAFDIYTRLSNTRSQLQAGVYTLSPSESTEKIVEHIISGNVDTFSITFLPGATLAENRTGLIEAGYSADEVDKALAKTYDSPLFADKPADTDLEGYMYGETYNFSSDASVEDVLKATFDEFYKNIQANDLREGFKKQGLNLYEGITLASIIQREVPHAEDQRQVAQVFYTRLASGMELGSDVTYQYAAEKMGVSPTPDLDSPYNTRKYPGLPPGPIATPGLTALKAVANPAEGDYVYFLSGDDDVTYFAKTNEEHEQNIVDHCQIKCSVF